MELLKYGGVLIKDPEVKSDVSAGGFAWTSIDLLVKENNSDEVFKFNAFGAKANTVIDMNLLAGSKLEVIFKIDCREGKGDYEGKYFTNLAIENVSYFGMEDRAIGVSAENIQSGGSYEASVGEYGSQNEDAFNDENSFVDPGDDLPF